MTSTSRFIILAILAIMVGFLAAGHSGIATMIESSPQPIVADVAPNANVVLGTSGYDLFWHRIAAGGETFSTGGGYSLGGTIGQHEAGMMSGSDFTLAGGFWAGATTFCKLADFNCDGVVDGSDLLILLSAWGPCADCGNCPADLTNTCTVDGSDLLILLANWG
jgi:hypothetical protein